MPCQIDHLHFNAKEKQHSQGDTWIGDCLEAPDVIGSVIEAAQWQVGRVKRGSYQGWLDIILATGIARASSSGNKKQVFGWAVPGIIFIIFIFSGQQLTDRYDRDISLPITGFELQIFGVGSDRSANCS